MELLALMQDVLVFMLVLCVICAALALLGINIAPETYVVLFFIAVGFLGWFVLPEFVQAMNELSLSNPRNINLWE